MFCPWQDVLGFIEKVIKVIFIKHLLHKHHHNLSINYEQISLLYFVLYCHQNNMKACQSIYLILMLIYVI